MYCSYLNVSVGGVWLEGAERKSPGELSEAGGRRVCGELYVIPDGAGFHHGSE